MIETIYEFIQTNLMYAPWTVFGLLLLAGFNLPISEDVLLFVSAVLAYNNPEYTIHLFTGVYLGAYFSDLIAYSLGRYIGPQLWRIKICSRLISKKRIVTVRKFYQKYGIITLIFGRFIPFGVRNAIFITAGLGKMNFKKFALSDLLACSISSIIYFNLYFFFGNSVINYVKKGNIIIFIVALLIIASLYIKKTKKDKLNKKLQNEFIQ